MRERRPVHPRALALVALLAAAMVTATYLQGALAVLSGFVIPELGITRSQLGVAFAVFSLTGAATSPVMGALTDRGSRPVMAALFALGAGSILLTAAAPGYGLLLVASVVGGLSLGAGNPVTNRVVSERISLARRGVVIGLKQAGPPLGLLAAGLVLPPLAVAFGWRTALAVTALLPLMGLVATRHLIPPGVGEGPDGGAGGPDARTAVIWLTVIGFGMAFGASAVIAFLPLYAQEQVGLSATAAGLLAASMGMAGVVGRILWGGLGGRFARPSTALLIISVVAVFSAVALAGSATLGPVVLWPAAVGLGASMLAWHAVGWLVIIDRVGTAGVGRASGTMQVGNGLGFAAGPPAAGLIIDLTGSYVPAWVLVAALFSAATFLTLWVRKRVARRRAAAAGGRS